MNFLIIAAHISTRRWHSARTGCNIKLKESLIINNNLNVEISR